MDLGLKGRTAIVCAASQGLGKASAMALAREGVNLVIAARVTFAIAWCPAATAKKAMTYLLNGDRNTEFTPDISFLVQDHWRSSTNPDRC